MSCPFYARSFFAGHMILESRSNRCALITSAHSPCWMEVSEAQPPDWSQCPRNPEYRAGALTNAVRLITPQVLKRCFDESLDLAALMDARKL